MDLLVKDESPSQVSDAIKDLLFAKTHQRSKISDQKLHHLFLTMMLIWTNLKVRQNSTPVSISMLSKYK